MSDYPTIRELILRARHDPSLSDEIDARTTAYLRGRAYDRHDHEADTGALRVWTGSGEPMPCLPYHRSRDALKTAHPPGWWFHEASRNQFRGEYPDGGQLSLRRPLDSELCATPELAELMSVLMAWEVEREVSPYRKLRATEVGAAAYVIALDGNENGALMIVADQAGVPPQQLLQGLVNRSQLATLTACAEAVWSGFNVEAGTVPPHEVSQALKDAIAATLDHLSAPMPIRPAP